MYDVNPLGPMMHLKELDRLARPQLWPRRPRMQNGFSLTAVSALVIAVLRGLHAVSLVWRTAGPKATS
jgi:hypothetical protein